MIVIIYFLCNLYKTKAILQKLSQEKEDIPNDVRVTYMHIMKAEIQ